MNKCVIYSNFSLGREYDVETKSAAKCAAIFGRAEGGEVVQVWNAKQTRLLSEARWSDEKKEYYRCNTL